MGRQNNKRRRRERIYKYTDPLTPCATASEPHKSPPACRSRSQLMARYENHHHHRHRPSFPVNTSPSLLISSQTILRALNNGITTPAHYAILFWWEGIDFNGSRPMIRRDFVRQRTTDNGAGQQLIRHRQRELASTHAEDGGTCTRGLAGFTRSLVGGCRAPASPFYLFVRVAPSAARWKGGGLATERDSTSPPSPPWPRASPTRSPGHRCC